MKPSQKIHKRVQSIENQHLKRVLQGKNRELRHQIVTRVVLGVHNTRQKQFSAGFDRVQFIGVFEPQLQLVALFEVVAHTQEVYPRFDVRELKIDSSFVGEFVGKGDFFEQRISLLDLVDVQVGLWRRSLDLFGGSFGVFSV